MASGISMAYKLKVTELAHDDLTNIIAYIADEFYGRQDYTKMI